MTQLFSPNAGLNGPLGSSMPDRFRTIGTGLADATVNAIVADRKLNQSTQWGLMSPGCDGSPNLNVMNDVSCCADNCPDTGQWVLINRQHGIPTLAGGAARPFVSTSGPPVVFRGALGDPCITDARISLLDTVGNKWRIVEQAVNGVVMAAGSLRSTGETPASPRPGSDPNHYESAFIMYTNDGGDVDPTPIGNQTWLRYPALTGANTGPSHVSGTSVITASGKAIATLPIAEYNSYYQGLPISNRGFFGECGWHVTKFDYITGVTWPNPYYNWHTGQSRGNQMVLGTSATEGCGHVQSDLYLFGLEAALPSGDNCAWIVPNPAGADIRDYAVPSSNLGVMVRAATGTGDALLRPLTWAPIPALYPGTGIVGVISGVPVIQEFNICACADGSVFVNPVGVKTVWQYKYDRSSNRLVMVRKITLAATGGAVWGADTILEAVLEPFG